MTQKAPAIDQKLKSLRGELTRQKLDCFLVPRQDEFQGEYVGAYAERLKWISGFSGSWGMAVIGRKAAAIFVDGRYTEQVRSQVPSKHYSYHHLISEPPIEWICKTFKPGSRIGYDPWLMAIGDAKRYAAACARAKLSFVPVSGNPIDAVWTDRPARPATPIVEHPAKFSGRMAADKLKTIREALASQKATAVVLTDPTSVAWAFNLRSSDVPFTPVPLAYALIPLKGTATIFAPPERASAGLRSALSALARFAPAEDILPSLKALARKKSVVMMDPVAAPDLFRITVEKAGGTVLEHQDPCLLPKATKNRIEQQGARQAQLRDGAALTQFLYWLEKTATAGKLSEGAAAEKLLEFRKANRSFRDLSFETISAAGGNAALPHYHAHGNGSQLKNDAIYLVDSGAQYPDGTTDVTRTVIIGTPTAEMRDRFTRVLKGMIAISTIVFPQGTTGAHLDVLAREALWRAGLDFDHGTGHGIGSYLSVHEGPQRISKTGQAALRPGMIISNEPGYYKPKRYGIRIENLLLVREAAKIAGGERPMLSFETLTLAPIDRRLIDTKLLARSELQWLDGYHDRVMRELGPLVDAATRDWLKASCAPLTR